MAQKPNCAPVKEPMLFVSEPANKQMLAKVVVPSRHFLTFPDPKRRLQKYIAADRPDLSTKTKGTK